MVTAVEEERGRATPISVLSLLALGELVEEAVRGVASEAPVNTDGDEEGTAGAGAAEATEAAEGSEALGAASMPWPGRSTSGTS